MSFLASNSAGAETTALIHVDPLGLERAAFERSEPKNKSEEDDTKGGGRLAHPQLSAQRSKNNLQTHNVHTQEE